MRAMGARRGRLSAPWPRFHGVDRADVYIIIHVRACCCGECELNPPPSPPIPRRRSSLTPPHSDTPFPSTSAPPRSPDARRQAARCIPRRPTTPSPPKAFARPEHFLTPFPSTSALPHATPTHARTATRPSRALPLPHAAPTHARRLRDARPQCAMHSPLPSQPIPRRRPSLAPHSDTPSQTLLLAHAAQMHARRPHDPFPAEELRPSPQRHAASPSVPLRAQKNGTAQWMCDAECLGRPSLRSVIGVGEPRAVRRRCGALAWRVGLRPQPWALRSRRCGRVLRA